MTLPLRPIPQSLSARRALRAPFAGIIPDPGRLVATSSWSMRAKSDANRNRPPKTVLNCRGARPSAFLSVVDIFSTASIRPGVGAAAWRRRHGRLRRGCSPGSGNPKKERLTTHRKIRPVWASVKRLFRICLLFQEIEQTLHWSEGRFGGLATSQRR